VFDKDKSHNGSVKLLGFQSYGGNVPSSPTSDGDVYESKSELTFRQIPITLSDAYNNVEGTQHSIEQIVNFQNVLAQEEKAAFLKQFENSTSNPIKHIHDSAVYQQSLCKLLEYNVLPLFYLTAVKKFLIQQEIAALESQLAKNY